MLQSEGQGVPRRCGVNALVALSTIFSSPVCCCNFEVAKVSGDFMIVGGAVVTLGVIAVGVFSALIVEKTPINASAGVFPCNSPAVISAAEKAIGIKKGPPDDLNLRNARDVNYYEATM
jgi:hypothetical protein